MKLLLITQSMDLDDRVLGFFHAWVEQFSKRLEEISVICLQKGRADVPKNGSIFSLGKEERSSKLQYLPSVFQISLVL